MNRFERWFLQRLCRKLVRQGWHHKDRITTYYRVMQVAARQEFVEDDILSLNNFLQGCHLDALKNNHEGADG